MTDIELNDDEFLALFRTSVAVSNEPLVVPQKIRISRGALDKAFAIGKIVDDITFGNYEWHGFMLVKEDDPSHTVRDIFIAQGAEISPGATNLDAQALTNASIGVAQLNKDKGTNYNIIGVIHSHGSGQVYHSRQDDEAFIHVINSYCGATQKYFRRPVRLIEGAHECSVKDGKAVLSGSNLEDAVLKFSPPSEEELRRILKSVGIIVPSKINDVSKIALEMILQSEMTVEQTVSTGFAYSVVVNLSKETYGEIGLREFAIITGQERISAMKRIPVEAVKEEKDVVYSDDELFNEINAKFMFSTGNGYGLKWRWKNLVRVWSQQSKRYVWEKEKPGPVYNGNDGRPKQSPLGRPAKEGGSFLGALQSLVGFGEAAGWDGEHYGHDPSSKPQWHSGSVPPPQYAPPHAAYHGAKYQASRQELVEKFDSSKFFNIDDLAYQFAYSALGYLSRFRHKECVYSQFMASALGILCSFRISADMENVRTAFRKAYDMSGGLNADDEKVPKPDLKISILNLHDKLLRNVVHDREQLEFMMLFSEASNIREQNGLIEKYSWQFLKPVEQSGDLLEDLTDDGQ